MLAGNTELAGRYERLAAHLANPPRSGQTRFMITYNNNGHDRARFIQELQNLGVSLSDARRMVEAQYTFTRNDYSIMRKMQRWERGVIPQRPQFTDSHLRQGNDASEMIEALQNNRYAGAVRRGIELRHNGAVAQLLASDNVINGYWLRTLQRPIPTIPDTIPDFW